MTATTSAPIGSASTTSAPDRVDWHAQTVLEALDRQGVAAERGLSAGEVETRRKTYGPNRFTEAEREPRWRAFVRQYQDPMQIVLLVAGILCLFLPGQFYTGILLMGLTLLNAAMGLNQEGKAEASVAALQKLMVVKAKVRRDGVLAEVPMEDIVPGDIVSIE